MSEPFSTLDAFEAAPVPLWEQDLSRVRQLLRAVPGDLEAHLDSGPEALDRFAAAIRSVRANRAALELFQAESEAELALSLERPFPHETRPVFRAHLVAFAERRGRFAAETAIRTLRGEARSVVLRSTLPGSLEAPDRALLSFVDITDRRRAELERDRFFELSLDLSCAVSVGDGHFEQVNPAFERTLGYPLGELHRQPFLDLVHPEDLTETRRSLERLARGQPATEFECRYRHRDGSYLWIAWRASLDPDGRRLYAVGRDETSRRRAAEALRESDERYRRLFDAVSDAVLILDPRAMTIAAANEAAVRAYGYPRAELVGLEVTRLSADPALTRRSIEALAGGQLSRFERRRNRHRRRDGAVFPVEISAGTFLSRGETLVYALCHDVTERERAEEARRESEAMLRSVTESSPDFIVLLDREARIAFVNRVLPQYSAESVVGRPVFDFLPDSEHPVVRASIERVLASGEPDRYETRYEGPEGEVRTFESRVAPVRKDGRVESVVIVGTDVTWRHDLVSELEARNAELERFSYTVSHDLKSPLISIRGFLGLLERDAEAGDPARIHDDVQRIRGATERMQELLEGLLELSRIGRVVNPPEKIDFRELASEAVSTFRERLDAEGISVRVDERGPPLWGDRRRLLEVVQNLLDNAVKHAGGGRGSKVEIGARGDAASATYYVRDDGVGIHPSYHDKVFGLFERLDGDSEGTGIGLALVKRIVEAHGGRVWVESEGAGSGATFCFTIPAPHPQP